MRTLIRNATVALPGGALARTDVLIDGDRIASIDAPAGARADETVNAEGLHLLPGIIDDQVHFREPGHTHKEDLRTATRACARGGVTSFLEMPNTTPTTTTVERLHEKLALASGKCMVNYGFYMGATCENLDELKAARRTPGIKIFIGSSTGSLLVDDQATLERIFSETTLPICAHCEDEATVRANAAAIGAPTSVHDHSRIRDHKAAVIATRRAIDLARRHQHRFHVLHVSAADEVELIREAGPLVTAEVCPHHLTFNIEDYDRLGTLVQMNPSLKTAADNRALWRALAEGVIGVVATDHAPHTLEEKQRPYPESPSGVPAVENLLPLMLNAVAEGRLTLAQLVDRMCEAPARIWSLARKGVIGEGYDADLVLVDLNKRQVVLNEHQATKCGWSPWAGMALRGWPVRTWVMGRTVWAKGKFDETVLGREIEFNRTSDAPGAG